MKIKSTDIDRPHAVAVFQWRETSPDRPEAVRGGWIAGAGNFLGFAAIGHGRYRDGGNPVLRGPLRETLAEAVTDAENVEGVEWLVVGHSIG